MRIVLWAAYMTDKKVYRVIAFAFGVFMVLSGVLLLSPVFDKPLDKINGLAFFVFAFFVFRYALVGSKS